MSYWDSRLSRKLDDEDPVDVIARGQDSAVDRAQLPPIPDEPASPPAPAAPPAPGDFSAFFKAHPGGIDLGSNEKQVNAIRAARDAVKGKGKRPTVDVGRPDMPEGPPRAFAEINAPTGDSPLETSKASTQVAGDTARGGGDSDMLDARLLASGRRTREGMNAAGRLIGYAGLPNAQQRAATSQQVAGNLDAPVAGLKADRLEARAAEDQGFQRENQGFRREDQGFSREKMQNTRDYGDEKSPISLRRRIEAMGLYPKEMGRIPRDVFDRMTAADVDVVLKELNMQKDRHASTAAMDRLFAGQVVDAGKQTAKQPYGEIENIASALEAEHPGITTGNYKGEDPVGGLGDRLALAVPGGLGERFASDKSLHTSKSLKELTDLIERMRSGAVINDSEAKHYTSLIGYGLGQDGRSLSMGVKTVLDSIRAKLRNQQAGYNYIRNEKGQTPLDVIAGQGATDFRKHQPGGGGGVQRKQGKDGRWYRNDGSGWEAE